MPSPSWRTVPTSERSVSTSYCSIRCLRIEVISSGRSFTVRLLRIPSRWSRARPSELAAQLVEAAAHAGVETQRADLEDEAADQARVDAAPRVDRPAERAGDALDEAVRLLVGELHRRGEVELEPALRLGDERLELPGDLFDLADAPLLHEEE